MASTKKQLLQRKTRGQGMTEYIIIVALIAIASVGVITKFGDNIRALFGMAADVLSGESSVKNRAKKSAPELEGKDMSNFAEKNSGY